MKKQNMKHQGKVEGVTVGRSLKAILAGLVLFAASASQAAPAVDRELVQFARGKQMQERKVRVVALMEMSRSEQGPRRYDSRNVVRFLKLRAQKNFDMITRFLERVEDGGQVRVVEFHWINNSLVADVSPAGLKALAKAPGVERIYLNRKMDEIKPFNRRPVRRDFFANIQGENWPYDLKDMSVDKLFEQHPKVDGSGILLGSVDTGVDAKHPALAGKVVAFYDASQQKRTEPFDEDSHGTHTIGTMVGGDRANVKIGMAPGAKMVATAALTGYDAMLKGMEYMLDPDGNPDTADFPRAINNSWNTNGAPDQELFYRAISAWEAAGILPIFSAGNAGPGDKTITKPHEHPSVVAVAATGPDGKVASFSSRGPGIFRGKETLKPDVSSPGVDVVSTVPGGRMEAMSGTSMAAPHITGLVALILQVNPKLTPVQVREILTKSAKFVDVNGNTVNTQVWTKTYGLGRSDALSAVNLAMKTRSTGLRLSSVNSFITPDQLVTVAFKPASVVDDTITASAFGQPAEGQNWVSANDVWSDY